MRRDPNENPGSTGVKDPDAPLVSAIIPCRNEEGYIEEVIEGLLEQDLPKERHELIFVDGSSEDRTPGILQRYADSYPHIRLLTNEKQHVPYAMNMGIEAAEGEIIIRLDAHASYPPNYLSFLSRKLKESGADNVGVPCITSTLGSDPKARAIRKVLSHPLGVGNSTFRLGTDQPQEVDTVPFGCYWKATLEKLGGYNPALHRNQDIELNKRLLARGGRIQLLPDISLLYYARESYRALARNNFRNGLWNILTLYITKDPSSLSLRHFIPLAFVLSLITPALAGIFMPVLLLLPLFVLTVYFLLIFMVSVRNKDDGTSLLHMLAAFFVLHSSYGVGSLLGLFRLDKLAPSERRPLG